MTPHWCTGHCVVGGGAVGEGGVGGGRMLRGSILEETLRELTDAWPEFLPELLPETPPVRGRRGGATLGAVVLADGDAAAFRGAQEALAVAAAAGARGE